MAYVDDLVVSGSAQMVKGVHLNDSGGVHPQACQLPHLRESGRVSGKNNQRLKNGNFTMEFSQKFIDELLKIFEVSGKVTTTGLKLGWLSSGMTSSIRPKSFQDHSSTHKIRISKLSFTCSSMSIRPETSSSSWTLSFQSEIRKASFQFRLSAIQIQIWQVVKNQGNQQVVHWFKCSMSTFSQPVELKLSQLFTHQRKASSIQ